MVIVTLEPVAVAATPAPTKFKLETAATTRLPSSRTATLAPLPAGPGAPVAPVAPPGVPGLPVAP